jgi:crossover junction endodeoxyribonuclease RuvC
MRIIGIDPGLSELGYAVVEKEDNKFRVLSIGSIRQSDPKEPLSLKLSGLFLKLERFLKEYRPELIAVEEVFSQTYPSATTKLAQAQALVFLLAGLYKITVETFNPLEVKNFLTGNGRANKKEIFKILSLMTESGEIEGVSKKELLNSHASDALAIAIVCFMKRGLG